MKNQSFNALFDLISGHGLLSPLSLFLLLAILAIITVIIFYSSSSPDILYAGISHDDCRFDSDLN